MAVSRSGLFAAFLLTLGGHAVAQTAINPGVSIQQIPQTPLLQPSTPTLPVPLKATPPAGEDSGPRFVVNSLHITGRTRFSEARLVAASGFKAGNVTSLSGLRALAARITAFYNQHGFVVAQAYLPAQEITNGAVTIAIVEGRYGKIGLDNRTNISDGQLRGVLGGLNSGDPITVAPLERRLLIMSDLPGVNVSSTLAPGTAVGTSDLLVGARPGPRVDGSLEGDNAGNPYTGRYRVGGTVNINEPLGIGDLLSARFLASTDGGMKYGRVFYQAPVGDATVGVAYTIFDYHLGKQFSSLDAGGTEQIGSLYASYPLIRSYRSNLNFFGDFDYRKLHDEIGLYDSVSDRQAFVSSGGLSGTYLDGFMGGGLTSYLVEASVGDLDIQTPLARGLDERTARTSGAYAKVAYDFSRLQHLVGPLSLYGDVRGQFASKNLDITEKMELGGAYQVRAYPEGEAYGDQGYIATVEARLLLPRWVPRLPGDVELIGFFDSGSVIFNKNPWYSGSNTANRSGAGGGVEWNAANRFSASLVYAHEIGNQRATSYDDHGGEIWFRIVTYF
jgi:hemolysin activation/secretion protein